MFTCLLAFYMFTLSDAKPIPNYYRPQRSCGQGYVFTRVCDSVNGGVSPESPPGTKENPPGPGRPPHRDQGEPPRTRQTPPGPRRTPPDQADPPTGTKENPPPGPGRPPRTKENPPRGEHCSIRSMSGWYASYWNAFLCYAQICKFQGTYWTMKFCS